MAIVTTKQIVEAPLSSVWASWDKFADVSKFHPGVADSYLVERSSETGLGAKRQCDLTDGKTYLKEKIIGYKPERQMVIDIYESNAPIKKAVVTIDFKPLSADRTEVNLHMDFTPKLGLVGKMIQPIMKKQFSKALGDLVSGNASYVEKQANAVAA